MTDSMWMKLIPALPPNLTVEQVSRVFRRSPTLTRRRLIESGYRFRTEQPLKLPKWVGEADWSLPNVILAREFGLSRERIRQYRNLLHKPKVESRGRKRQNYVGA